MVVLHLVVSRVELEISIFSVEDATSLLKIDTPHNALEMVRANVWNHLDSKSDEVDIGVLVPVGLVLGPDQE